MAEHGEVTANVMAARICPESAASDQERGVSGMTVESRPGWIRSMRPARLAPLLALMMMAVMLLAGCGANAASDPLLAAKVNGHPVTLAQYQQMLALYR